MGTSVGDAGDDDQHITVSRDGDWFVARDETTGVASQGKTKPEALSNLADALELYERPVAEDDEPTDPADAPWL